MRRNSLASLLSFLLVFASLSPLAPRAQTTSAGSTHPSAKSNPTSESFVIYMDDNGDATCRAATPAEKRQIESVTPKVKRISPILDDASYSATAGSSATTNAATTGTNNLLPSAGLHIILRGTPQLEANPAAKQAFLVAANRWEAVVSTPITVVIDADLGTSPFGSTTPYGTNILGSTSNSLISSPLSTVRGKLISNFPTPEELPLYNALPLSSIPVEFPTGTITTASNVLVSVANARALGMVPNIDPNSVTPTSPANADARIGFNSSFTFDFDPSDGITPGTTSFDSVAVHEIGHALGFSSRSGDDAGNQNNLRPSLWDLFRFRPGTVNAANFATAPRVMALGGEQIYFNNQQNAFNTLELNLSTGGPSPAAGGGCGVGSQSSHWRDDGSCGPYIGIMDPTIPRGRQDSITNNDLKALDSFGYFVGGSVPPPPPPPPAPANDAFASAFPLSGSSGSVNGTNVSATRELGESLPTTIPGGKSVWYSWVAPATGSATFDTVGSSYDTTLGVYTGSAVNALALVVENDDIQNGVVTDSRVNFTATAGTTYRIMVDGYSGESGDFKLNWTAASAPLTLLLEEGTNRVAALDAVTQLRGPFRITTLNNFSRDQRTRVMLYTSTLGTDASIVAVQAGGVQLPVESVGQVPGFPQFSYVVVRLGDSPLPTGDLPLTVSLRGTPSSAGTISIAP